MLIQNRWHSCLLHGFQRKTGDNKFIHIAQLKEVAMTSMHYKKVCHRLQEDDSDNNGEGLGPRILQRPFDQ